MKWATIAALATTANAAAFPSLGGCKAVDKQVVIQGKKHNDIADTYLEVGSSDGHGFIQLRWFDFGFGGFNIYSQPYFYLQWVDDCSRHELMQIEDYPIYNWQRQTQMSGPLGLMPMFTSEQHRWVYADHRADGWWAAGGLLGVYPEYKAQKANGFSFRDSGDNEDMAVIYKCESGPGFMPGLDIWKWETAYVLKTQESKRSNEVVMAEGAKMLAKLDGWTVDSISPSSHVEDSCNYPVQILIGNETPLYCGLVLGPLDVGQFAPGCNVK